MHSREPDQLDARDLVDRYVRFGDGPDAVPAVAREVMIALAAEVFSIARKEEYETLSSIADLCSSPKAGVSSIPLISKVCHTRLAELSDMVGQKSISAVSGRPPTFQIPDTRNQREQQLAKPMSE